MLNRIKAFLLGMSEFRLTCTTNLEADGLQSVYDHGREWTHRLTFRKMEP